MATSMTRGTIIWFIGSAVVGTAAGGLHLLRSELGGAHTGLPLAVGAFALTALAAAMLFHGVVLAGREQDAAAGPPPVPVEHGVAETWPEEPTPQDSTEPVEAPEVYTFRAGKPVGDRSRGPAKRDRSRG